MRNRDVEEKLNTALSHAVPDVLGGILSGCEEQEGKVIPMTTANNEMNRDTAAKRRRRWIPVGSVAAIMLLVAGSVYGVNWKNANTVDSVIALDVNPSIELQVSKTEKVIQAAAINEDGKQILDGMDLKGTDLDVAVNALIGSMMKNGYIDDLANSILITVDNDDAQRGADMQKRLVNEINRILSAGSIDGAILSQNLTPDQTLQKLADQYAISVGKASLIQNMVSQNSLWKFEDLAGLTINELNLLAESKHTQLGTIAASGAASDKAYIGEAKAKQAALSHAGVSAAAAKIVKVEFDWEDGRAEYEVEFYSGSTEYEYDIDAKTGAVLHFERDAMAGSGNTDRHSATSDDGVTSSTGNAGNNSGTGGAASGNYIGETKAQNAALSHAGLSASQVTIYKTKLDRDDGRMIYEVEFYTGNTEYDYDIDAVSGKVLSYDKDIEDQDFHTTGTTSNSGNGGGAQASADAYIGESKAKSIAQAKAPDAVIKKVELDDDDGRMVYELELRNGNIEHDCKIDAVTGEVLKWETEEDDD